VALKTTEPSRKDAAQGEKRRDENGPEYDRQDLVTRFETLESANKDLIEAIGRGPRPIGSTETLLSEIFPGLSSWGPLIVRSLSGDAPCK